MAPPRLVRLMKQITDLTRLDQPMVAEWHFRLREVEVPAPRGDGVMSSVAPVPRAVFLQFSIDRL